MRNEAMLCRHCRRRKQAEQKRGLCNACYMTPDIRQLYPNESTGTPNEKYAKRGSGLMYRRQPMPTEPTTAAQGTEAKVQVLAERAARGESLWHPSDA